MEDSGYFDLNSGEWVPGDSGTPDSSSGATGWLSGITSLGNTASNILKALNPNATPTTTAASATSASLTKAMPWLIIGAVLLVVVMLFARK